MGRYELLDLLIALALWAEARGAGDEARAAVWKALQRPGLPPHPAEQSKEGDGQDG